MWLLACLAGFLVSGCEPGVQLGWDTDVKQTVDPQCIYGALKTVAPTVERLTYLSDGYGFMPKGAEVVQFFYATTKPEGTFLVDVAKLPSGGSRLHHEWGKVGTVISKQERDVVEPLLRRANKAIADRCGVTFRNDEPNLL